MLSLEDRQKMVTEKTVTVMVTAMAMVTETVMAMAATVQAVMVVMAE